MLVKSTAPNTFYREHLVHSVSQPTSTELYYLNEYNMGRRIPCMAISNKTFGFLVAVQQSQRLTQFDPDKIYKCASLVTKF